MMAPNPVAAIRIVFSLLPRGARLVFINESLPGQGRSRVDYLIDCPPITAVP
jgi:hypothetical protein